LSQIELCRRARLDRRGWQVVEAGLALPRLDSLVRICKALNIELGDVVEEYVDG
jgi:DNA-binding Xre family transcriptional regulator